MKIVTTGLLFMLATMAGNALAGESGGHRMSIAIVEDDGDSATRLEIDSDDLDFRLDELEVGENRSFVDREGRNVLVTRTGEGLRFDVDGKSFDVPAVPDVRSVEHGFNFDTAPGNDFDVHVVQGANWVTEGAEHGVTIVSGKPLDESTRQSIEAALQSAGHDKVRFVDAAADGVKVIEKRVVRESK